MAIKIIATDKNFNYEKSYSNAWLYKIIINIKHTNFNLYPPLKKALLIVKYTPLKKKRTQVKENGAFN